MEVAEPIKIKDLFKKTKLWEQLESKKEHTKISLIEELVDYALPLLDRIIETFPTYTLHNGQHQLNILNRMADLLGERISELTTLETAILILSAFYHDIGMVFTKSELENLPKEEDFGDFIIKNPSARLAINRAKELPINIAEWYCRWAHAKRVWIYLNKNEDKLMWDGLNYKKELTEVCLSHNEDTSYLKNDKFETNFWETADLRFCAIILRLADILDFDNSRSPESVFEYLKLEDSREDRNKASYAEWNKHLAARGFLFNKWNPTNPYEIDFRAVPTHPAVESDIKEFLNTIEFEIQKCSTILKFCSSRWNNFALPDSIKRNNIRSQGYKFGDYKFSLDQHQILNLLMGENLYDDHFVFIRELIQNAIDTSRDREFHEHKNGNIHYKVEPIEISTWIDTDGYRWLRVDDYGMGMTEEIIEKYFLRVGNSYYNSDEFKVRKLTYQNVDKIDFTPISRFGIGILSCFIAGDRIDVNTRSIYKDNHQIYPIRLSLKGLHNFYVMQTGKDTSSPMPADGCSENGYRLNVGTSIAVRIRMDKDRIEFDVKNILDKLLLNPPVKVHLKGTGIVGEYPNIINNKWCRTHSINICNEDINRIEKTFNVKIKSKLTINLFPIDLTKTSPNSNLKGQLAIIYIPFPQIELNKIKHNYSKEEVFDNSDELFSDEESDVPPFEFNFSYRGIKSAFEKISNEYFLEIEEPNNYDRNKKIVKINLMSLLKKLSLKKTDLCNNFVFTDLLLTHNGIGIPNENDIFNSNVASINLNIKGVNRRDGVSGIGIIELKDELRPNLSLARNKITCINWNTLSQLNYSIYKALQKISVLKANNQIDMVFLKSMTINDMLYKELVEDNLISGETSWVKEKIINFNKGYISIENINKSKNGYEILLDVDSYSFNYGSKFECYLIYTLLQMHCDVIGKLYSSEKWYEKNAIVKFIVSKKKNTFVEGVSFFPPFTFVKYENFDGLKPEYYSGPLNKQEVNFNFLNINHRYSKWFIKASKILYNDYSVYYWTLIRAKKINSINETLTRLRNVLPVEFKPPKDLILSKKDLTVNLKTLKMLKNKKTLK